MYRVRGLWAKSRSDQIIVFNLTNAVPMALPEDSDNTQRKRRVMLCPDEWTDDFGEEFYEHVLENGFYYLTPDYEWHANAESIPAPGMEQFRTPSADALQLSIDTLTRGTNTDDD